MSKSSKQGIIVTLVIALSVGGLLALRFFQGRQGESAQAAGPQSGPPGQMQRGGQNQQRGGPGGGSGGGNFGNNRPPLVEVGLATEGVVRERLALVGALRPKQQVEVVPPEVDLPLPHRPHRRASAGSFR